jgi:AcrR family transcriptional regulator
VTDGPSSRRREATRQRVLDAARDVFAERGIIGGTVEEICAAAGFTRGAFYSNFPDKITIVRELLAREEERLLSLLDGDIDLPAPPPGGFADITGPIRQVLGRLLSMVPADRKFSLIKTEMEISAIRDPEIAEEFRLMDAHFRARVQAFLLAAASRLNLRILVDPVDATDAIICIFERSARRALLDGGTDANALALSILPSFIAGIVRPMAPSVPTPTAAFTESVVVVPRRSGRFG